MKLALTRIVSLIVALAGCATTASPPTPSPPAPQPEPGGRMKSGSFVATYSENVSLASGTVYSAARYVGTMDNVGIDLYAASGSAACTVAVEVSNRYNPATSVPTDDTLWNTYAPTGWSAPANLTGATSNYYIEMIPLSGQYERLKFVCSSGTTTLAVTAQMKGG